MKKEAGEDSRRNRYEENLLSTLMADAGDNQRRSAEKESKSIEETKVKQETEQVLSLFFAVDYYDETRIDMNFLGE